MINGSPLSTLGLAGLALSIYPDSLCLGWSLFITRVRRLLGLVDTITVLIRPKRIRGVHLSAGIYWTRYVEAKLGLVVSIQWIYSAQLGTGFITHRRQFYV